MGSAEGGAEPLATALKRKLLGALLSAFGNNVLMPKPGVA